MATSNLVTPSKIIKALGQPDGYSNPEFNPTYYDAILYGSLEFNFRQDKLNSISNSHVLNWSTWRFNRDFHYQNDYFKITSWFSRTWIDTRLEKFKRKIDSELIEYNQDIFYDAIRLKFGDNLELLFSSKESYHKEPNEWTHIDTKILNPRLSHFFLFQPDK